MTIGCFGSCHVKPKVVEALVLRESGPVPRNPGPCPQTEPCAQWREAGLDGIERVVHPNPEQDVRIMPNWVSMAWDTVLAQPVIVKKHSSIENARREFDPVRDFCHPCIKGATRLGVIKSPNRPTQAFTVAPLAPGRPLASLGVIVGYRRVLLDCLDGLAHLHCNGVVHRDLHEGNIITDCCEGYIIDFDRSVRSAQPERRRADVEKMLGSFSRHVPAADASAFEAFSNSRLVRRWRKELPTREQLSRHAYFASINNGAPNSTPR